MANELSDTASSELKSIAKQHPSFESFLQEVQRFADRAWHTMRNEGDQADTELDSGVAGVEKNVFDTPSAPAPASDAPVLPQSAAPVASDDTSEVPQPAVEDDHRSNAELRGPAAS